LRLRCDCLSQLSILCLPCIGIYVCLNFLSSSSSPSSRSNRSAAYASLRMWDKAIADGNECVRLRPDWAKGYCRLGAAYEVSLSPSNFLIPLSLSLLPKPSPSPSPSPAPAPASSPSPRLFLPPCLPLSASLSRSPSRPPARSLCCCRYLLLRSLSMPASATLRALACVSPAL
jgi:hypothetical protein